MPPEETSSADVAVQKKTVESPEEGIKNPEGDSIVSLVLNNLNFKKLLELVFYKQSLFKVTQNFIDLLLLFILLTVIFWVDGILKPEMNSAALTLVGIAALLIAELLNANFGFLKGLFANDVKTQNLLKQLPYMTHEEAKEAIRLTNFSPKYLDVFIDSLEKEEKYDPEIILAVIDSQPLRIANLEKLFTVNTIKRLDDGIILKLLFKYGNTLKKASIRNIYEACQDNDKIMKMLFATSQHGDFLLKEHPDDQKLKEHYETYRVKKKHMDIILQLTPISWVEPAEKWIALAFFSCVLYRSPHTIRPAISGAESQRLPLSS